jgi:2-(1,2-epoxy-1,2-dihydrophenyl)acetyl-CoA isomerase
MEVARWLHELPKPTIAMVRGAAAGAGLSLAMACDLRIAGEGARFAPAFARVGYSGDFGGSWFLTQLVGTAKAREPTTRRRSSALSRPSPSASPTGWCNART